MKLCGSDCHASCVNCKHWQSIKRLDDRKAPCGVKNIIAADYHRCGEFECVNAEETKTLISSPC